MSSIFFAPMLCMIRPLLLAFGLITLAGVAVGQTDKVYLKNGLVIEGIIQVETETTVKIQVVFAEDVLEEAISSS